MAQLWAASGMSTKVSWWTEEWESARKAWALLALRKRGRAQRLLARPLHQTLCSSLVQPARRAAARFVAQAIHALLAPAPPSLAHSADVELLQLGRVAAQQG
jgi:hypothetical protein